MHAWGECWKRARLQFWLQSGAPPCTFYTGFASWQPLQRRCCIASGGALRLRVHHCFDTAGLILSSHGTAVDAPFSMAFRCRQAPGCPPFGYIMLSRRRFVTSHVIHEPYCCLLPLFVPCRPCTPAKQHGRTRSRHDVPLQQFGRPGMHQGLLRDVLQGTGRSSSALRTAQDMKPALTSAVMVVCGLSCRGWCAMRWRA
jgi:hypothetical protein